MVNEKDRSMRKQLSCILIFLFSAAMLSALDLKLNGGSNKWGFAAPHNGLFKKWDGSPVTITLNAELFNAPGMKRPAMPWQSWFGILMEDRNNRYAAGLISSGSRTPEINYGAVVYEKRGNFSIKKENHKHQLSAGPVCLRLVFKDSELTLFAGKSENTLEQVWSRSVSKEFKPEQIGITLDSAQKKSVLERLTIHSFETLSAAGKTVNRFENPDEWQKNLLSLELVLPENDRKYTDITELLNRELSQKTVRIPRGNYTFGKVRIPADSSLIFESGAEIRVTNETCLKLAGNRCTVEGGIWRFPVGGRKEAVISGQKVSGIVIRGIVSANFGRENLAKEWFNFAEFDSCSDFLAENNSIAGVANMFSFHNCRRVTVRNNKAMYCERMTCFRNGSETLRHSGNWSREVTFQCQWWGGDANDTKKQIRDNTARIMIRELKPGDANYYEHTAGTYDIIAANNIAEYGTCLAWGSKGRNIVITGNIARYMNDLAYDTEGGENIIVTGNLSINSKCAGIGAYFYGSRLLIANNQILILKNGEKKYQGGFLRLHSPGKNTHFGNGKVFITGNQFINEINPKAALNVEAARNVVISGNSFTGGGIALLPEAEDIVITGNTFETAEFMKNPVISFAGNRRSRRIIRDNLFLNTGRILFPALSSNEHHKGGTLVAGGNLFEGFRPTAELKGNGLLKGMKETSPEWKTGNWK